MRAVVVHELHDRAVIERAYNETLRSARRRLKRAHVRARHHDPPMPRSVKLPKYRAVAMATSPRGAMRRLQKMSER